VTKDNDIVPSEEMEAAAPAPTDSDQDEAMSAEEQEEVAEIRADIEETRREMGGTLTQLGDRLEPGHLVEQAKDNVREATIGRVEETAKGMSDMVMDTIKRNPVPAALAGAGLALLWANRSKADQQARPAYGYRSQPASEGQGMDLGTKVGDAASTVGNTVRGAVGSVAEGAQNVGGDVVERGGETVQEVGIRLDTFMKANPLAVAAIAAGAGAAIGSLVPETSKEREMLGDASRQVTSTVRDTVGDVTTKAEETIDRVEEQVGSPV
jgi:hypothetical protein